MDDKYDGATPADTQTTQARPFIDDVRAYGDRREKIGRMQGLNDAARYCLDAGFIEASELLGRKFDEIQ